MDKQDRIELHQDITKDVTRTYEDFRTCLVSIEKYLIEEKPNSGKRARRLLKGMEMNLLDIRRKIMPRLIEDEPFKKNPKNAKLLNNFGDKLRSKEYLKDTSSE